MLTGWGYWTIMLMAVLMWIGAVPHGDTCRATEIAWQMQAVDTMGHPLMGWSVTVQIGPDVQVVPTDGTGMTPPFCLPRGTMVVVSAWRRPDGVVVPLDASSSLERNALTILVWEEPPLIWRYNESRQVMTMDVTVAPFTEEFDEGAMQDHDASPWSVMRGFGWLGILVALAVGWGVIWIQQARRRRC